MHLRGYGWITVFKFAAKNDRVDYVTTNLKNPTRDQKTRITKARWSIEIYHRELKQTCGIERCQDHTGRAKRNHICLTIQAWLDKHGWQVSEKITFYQKDWNIIKKGVSNGIRMILATT